MKFDQLFMVDGRESKEKCFNVRKGKHKVFSFAGSLESENPFHENWREFLQEFPFLIKNLRSSVEKKFLMEEKFVKWILIAVFLTYKALLWTITLQLSTMLKLFGFRNSIWAFSTCLLVKCLERVWELMIFEDSLKVCKL